MPSRVGGNKSHPKNQLHTSPYSKKARTLQTKRRHYYGQPRKESKQAAVSDSEKLDLPARNYSEQIRLTRCQRTQNIEVRASTKSGSKRNCDRLDLGEAGWPRRASESMRLALRDESEKVPGFLLSISRPRYGDCNRFRVQLTTVNTAVLERSGKAVACAQRDCTNKGRQACYELL